MFQNSEVKISRTVINGQKLEYSGSLISLCNTNCTYLIPYCTSLYKFDINWNFIDSYTNLPYCFVRLIAIKSGNDYVYYGCTY
jgi:hypothetical protein